MKSLIPTFFYIFLISINSYAIQKTLIQVMQPNVVEDNIEKSISPYNLYIGYPGGYFVGLTCSAYSIQMESKTDSGVI